MKRLLGGLLTALFILTPVMANAADYYVDATAGNDTNNGTSTSTPWKTITKVNGVTLQPGDNVYFKRGETFTDARLTLLESGTAGNVITFGAYGSGAKPVIAPSSGRGIAVNGVSYVDLENILVTTPASEAVFFNGTNSNINFTNFDMATSSMGFYMYAGPNADITVTNSTSTNAGIAFNLASEVTDTTFDGLYVATSSNSGFSTNSAAIDNVTITNSTLDDNAIGMIFGPAGSVTITDTTIRNSATYGIRQGGGATGSITVRNSILSGNGSAGFITLGTLNTLRFLNSTSTTNGTRGLDVTAASVEIATSTVENNVTTGVYLNNVTSGSISNSLFDGNGTGESGSGNGLFVGGAGTTTITGSTFSNNRYDGIGGGGTAHIICDQCTIDDNGIDGTGGNGDGFSLHNSSTAVLKNSTIKDNKKGGVVNINTTDIDIYNNIFSHETTGTLPMIDIEDGSSATIYNNTLVNTSQQGTGVRITDTSVGVIRNNLVYGFNTGISDSTTGAFTESNNLVYNVGSTAFSGFTASDSSLTSDPKLTDLAGGDYTLLSTSPAINAGTDMGRSTDKAGNSIMGAPDIGAYEYQWISPTASFTSSASRRTVTFVDGSSDSDGSIASWLWDFGDGETSSVASPEHGFPTDSTYTVSLTVTDNHGATDTASVSLPVEYGISGGGIAASSGSKKDEAGADPSTETLLARIAELRAELARLLALRDGMVTGLPLGYTFTRDLTLGSTGEAVQKLQQFLNASGHIVQPSAGDPGSPGHESLYFGDLTQGALMRFQSENNIEPAVGYFGPITRSVVNAQLAPAQ